MHRDNRAKAVWLSAIGKTLTVAAVFAMLAGCHLTADSQVTDVAEQLCRCVEPLNAQCTEQIKSFLGASVDDACVACVFDNERTCAAMIDQCPQLCLNNLPTGQTP